MPMTLTQAQPAAPIDRSAVTRLPIVYVRGYAGTTNGINATVNDPFYGFNTGATHVRVDGDGDPAYYQFEGPLLRLLTEEGYKLLVHGDQRKLLEEPGPQLEQASIWVHRFYDTAATSWEPPTAEGVLDRVRDKFRHAVSSGPFNIEAAATDLYVFITDILERTGAAKVLLVAHSMGGLVARCTMQKICETRDKDGIERRRAREIVDKLFTFGTPHGGIVMGLGAVNKIEEVFGPAGSDIFSPPKMYGYLTPTAKYGDEPKHDERWDPRVVPPETFDVDDIFCIVGTDPADYGLPRLVVGPQSDGLVRMTNAYVKGAHRAYIYKSHSGAYGEVNSEEGYQNLKRFLFGRWAVSLSFAGLPEGVPDTTWQADMRLSIRGLPIVMSEQQAAHWCPIALNKVVAAAADGDQQRNVTDDRADAPIPIVSTFLLEPEPPEKKAPAEEAINLSRYVVTLRVYQIVEKHGAFDFTDHLEQVADWADSLVVDVGPTTSAAGVGAWTAWNAEIMGAISSMARMPTSLALSADTDGLRGYVGRVELPPSAKALPIFGAAAWLRVTVHDRLAGNR
jgi:pimeloyl-ACP methyl ester carboxylesterase